MEPPLFKALYHLWRSLVGRVSLLLCWKAIVPTIWFPFHGSISLVEGAFGLEVYGLDALVDGEMLFGAIRG
jgi:hypothetical protein